MSIMESLQRQISEAAKVSPKLIPELSRLAISDRAAWEFAGELAAMQMLPAVQQADIYEGLKQGGMKFMGWPVEVASSSPDA